MWGKLGIGFLLLICMSVFSTCTAKEIHDKDSVRIGIESCTYGPTSDPEFREFEADAITCVYPGNGEAAILTILSVDIERYCEHRQGPCDRTFPLPRILNKQQREVGRLPDNFPGEAAVKYDIVLQNFKDDWPQSIVLLGESIGVGTAPHWTPLKWDNKLGQFKGGVLQK